MKIFSSEQIRNVVITGHGSVRDLNTKRARIHGISPDGTISVVDAEVPLAEVQRYASDLRSLTQGRGTYELTFDHYGEVPANLAERVISDQSEGEN